MKLEDIRSELDEEYTWRLEEIRFFKNRLSELRRDDEKDRFRRAMAVMLYANFEGFWKTAFSIYVKAINSYCLRCVDAAEPLVAASMANAFESMSDNSKKSAYFRRTAPDDAKLHRFCRQAEFAGRIREFDFKTVNIEVEDIVDAESNLKPIVIRKILYRLGFDHELFLEHEGAITRLLGLRNRVTHGETRGGITEGEYEKMEVAVHKIMRNVIQYIYDALRDKNYLRARPGEYVI